MKSKTARKLPESKKEAQLVDPGFFLELPECEWRLGAGFGPAQALVCRFIVWG
jgi:hypothetical protein